MARVKRKETAINLGGGPPEISRSEVLPPTGRRSAYTSKEKVGIDLFIKSACTTGAQQKRTIRGGEPCADEEK